MMMNKTIYRDNTTNRLITKKVAEQRDPSTWTEERFKCSYPIFPALFQQSNRLSI